ncbi:hypothetical protein QFZ98_003895 [Paraburkholderia youngii]
MTPEITGQQKATGHQITVRTRLGGMRVAAVWQVLMSVAREIERVRIDQQRKWFRRPDDLVCGNVLWVAERSSQAVREDGVGGHGRALLNPPVRCACDGSRPGIGAERVAVAGGPWSLFSGARPHLLFARERLN